MAIAARAPCLPRLLLLLFITLSASASPLRWRPRLGLKQEYKWERSIDRQSSLAPLKDYEMLYYDQTLDHFNYQPESYTTFQQRYFVGTKHWRGADVAAPIIAALGAESSVERHVGKNGFMIENARRFGAVELYIEHRYYGESIPFGSSEEALRNATIRGYFNSAQALADYAEIIVHLKKKLSAESSPVIVAGGSYGGMLAAWFRLKYPHVAIGALASSAPILYFDDLTPSNAYNSVVTQDFKEASLSCYNTIKQSWSEIDRVAAEPNGLSILGQKFKTCNPLENVNKLKDYLDNMYAVAAQYDSPPLYPVTIVCNGIDKGSEGTDILGRIFSGIVAFRGKTKCYDLSEFYSSETLDGWDWQTCSEMVQPIGRGANDTMFYNLPFDYNEYSEHCKRKYGVLPRPHWITTFYGGHDIKTVLKRFGSNIIFSNGLRDPWSRAGVLEDISDSLVAVYTTNGSHCLDMGSTKEGDPEWLTLQRKKEVEIIKGWIDNYYKDLHNSS